MTGGGSAGLGQGRWSVFVHEALAGTLNMAADELLLNRASSPEALPATYLRFYRWDRPTLSLGFSQKAERVVDFEFCDRNVIPVVRRLTGGKAVLHDQELTYAVISNDPLFFPLTDIAAIYEKIATALRAGLERLNLKIDVAPAEPPSERAWRRPRLSAACFAATNHHELLCGGRKLVGSAQRRTKGAFLQHGSILFHFDASLLAGALRLGDAQALRSQVTDLQCCLGTVPSPQRVIGALLEGFRDVFRVPLVEEDGLSLEGEASVLSCTKYADPEWTLRPKMA